MRKKLSMVTPIGNLRSEQTAPSLRVAATDWAARLEKKTVRRSLADE
jgi:hypothetical protein